MQFFLSREILFFRKELENKKRLIDKLCGAVNLNLYEMTNSVEIANNNYQLHKLCDARQS